MPSPFLDIPESEWIAENERAFAIYDNYPVSKGPFTDHPKGESPHLVRGNAIPNFPLKNLG